MFSRNDFFFFKAKAKKDDFYQICSREGIIFYAFSYQPFASFFKKKKKREEKNTMHN